MAVTGTEGLVLLLGRLLFGGVIAFTGFNHFLQTESMTGYVTLPLRYRSSTCSSSRHLPSAIASSGVSGASCS